MSMKSMSLAYSPRAIASPEDVDIIMSIARDGKPNKEAMKMLTAGVSK